MAASGGRFELVDEAPQLPLACFRLADRERLPYTSSTSPPDLPESVVGLSPPTACRPTPQNEVVMRALVKENVSHSAARILDADVAKACEILDKRGSSLPDEVRSRAKTNVGF